MKESPKDGRRAENARKKKNKKARKVAGILLAVFAAVFAVVAAICFALPRNEEPQSPTEPTETPSSSSPTDATEGTSASDEPTTEPTTEPVTEPTTEKPQYPETGNESGTLVKYGSGILRVGNRAFSPDGYVDSVASKYAQLVSETADALAGTVKVYDLLIPTSYGVMMPDDIKPKIANYGDQGKNIETVFSKMSGNVVPVRCFENLMEHRSEYLYFRTDHHWNGIGAYYAYESFCKTKGITPYTMKQRKEVT
ncbi:MAG: DHHW family protein, partial [Eubacteriales bacterium]|nr:DHHW family protein [Eubacteriales bacterium]